MGYLNEFPHVKTWDSDLRQILEMFEDVKGLPKSWEEFSSTMSADWSELKEFVNSYFDDLDVQNEINNKIDALVSDGTIETIMQRLFDSYSQEVALLNARMDTFTSLPVGSTSGDAELVDIRVDFTGKVWDNAGASVRGITSQLSSDIVELEETLDETVEKRNLVFGLPTIPRIYVNGNSTGDSDWFFTVKDIPVVGGVTYYVHCDMSHSSESAYVDARFITEYDASGGVIKATPNVKRKITLDNATVKVDITFFYIKPYPTCDTGFYYFSPYPLTENTRLRNNDDRTSFRTISDLEVLYEEMRKATITFSFDDGVEQDSQIVKVFDDYGAKCGFALESTILTNERFFDYRELYKRGYSILCHSNSGDRMGDESNYSQADLLAKMRDTKMEFEKFGVKISGWVTPSSYLKNDYVPTLQKFYNYGYTRYLGEYADTSKTPYDDTTNNGYYMKRVHIGTTSIENLKIAVDKAIENNGLLSFYSHAYELTDGMLDIAKLKELLSYIKQKEYVQECHLYAPDEAMMYYFRTRHSDLLS